jgi:SAM-dependent methyltransferase
VLDIFGAVAFHIVHTAVKLRVFDTLHQHPLEPAELARELDTDERGITVLLEALTSLGYVTVQDGRYANTAMTAKWLVRNSPANISAGFEYWGAILSQLWDTLEESIRTGQPPTNLYQWIEHQPDVSRDFQAWMVAAARLIGPEIVRKVKLPPTARRLLDVGGGHAMYSIALCRRYTHLSATVFDSAEALKVARVNIDAASLQDRIRVHEGDFLRDELGSGYDVALVFNIVHGFSPEQNVALLRSVAAALNAGGVVVIAEQVAGKAPGPTAGAQARLLGLSYFHLLGGQIFRYDEIVGWLTIAGFTNVRRSNLLKAPGTSLIVATKER